MQQSIGTSFFSSRTDARKPFEVEEKDLLLVHRKGPAY